jgi:hypothetical protein
VWRTLVARAETIKASAPRPRDLGAQMLLPVVWPPLPTRSDAITVSVAEPGTAPLQFR